MSDTYIISQLERNNQVFLELLAGIPDELIRWRNQPDKWNLLEVVCHLYDEEREDFRARIMHVFEKPEEPFPSIDPQGWVKARNYSSKNFYETLNDFVLERKKSVEGLLSLKNPKWSNAFQHPKFGPISGSMLLANWLAHDYLHFRQIIKLKYDYLAYVSGEKMDYAGTW